MNELTAQPKDSMGEGIFLSLDMIQGGEGVSAYKICAGSTLKILATYSVFTEAVSSAELHEFR